jgi:outer membrane receptor protein involved in Fe transport
VFEISASSATPRADADGERGYHTFANLIWGAWSFTAYFNSRDKQPPVGVGTSLQADPAQHVVDGRNLLAASYKRHAGPGELHWQFSYDQYRYRDLYDYPVEDRIVAVEDYNRGDWLNTEITYELPVRGVGPLTIGVAAVWDLRSRQYNLAEGIRQDIISEPERGAAVFAQQEWEISPRWSIFGGLRLDGSSNYGAFLSPRLAAVFQPSSRTAYKLVYGRPFRNPSAFEQFYNDGGLSYAAAPPLEPEVAHTFEGSVEHQAFRGFTVVASGFHYRFERLITAVEGAAGVLQYRNHDEMHTTGGGVELSGRVWDRVEARASAAFQNAVGGLLGNRLPNAPAEVSKFRMGVPFGRERLFLAASAQYTSSRLTWSGDRLGGAWKTDFTATARLHPRLELQAGVRNTFDRPYEDPIYLSTDRFAGDGRSVFVRLVWRAWE